LIEIPYLVMYMEKHELVDIMILMVAVMVVRTCSGMVHTGDDTGSSIELKADGFSLEGFTAIWGGNYE